MHEHNESFQITARGIKYIIFYALFALTPFFFCLGKAGMTCVIGKTLGYITLPFLLIAWAIDLDFFHKYFWLLSSVNVIINFFILLWLGSLMERKNE